MITVEPLGYATAGAFFLFLSLLALTSRHSYRLKFTFATASLLSAIWAGAVTHRALFGSPAILVQLLEPLRDLAWFGFLFVMLTLAYQPNERASLRLRRVFGWVAAFTAGLLFLTIYRHTEWAAPAALTDVNLYAGHVLMSVGVLVLLEQLCRNSLPALRRGIKYLCMGIGSMFAFDFFLYSDAMLFRQITPVLWDARGFIHAIVAPVIGIAITRRLEWPQSPAPQNNLVSRRLVFHTTALLGAGLYLLIMGTGGYYVRIYGGDWGIAAQAAFLFASGLLLAILLFSGQLRAWLRVIISKHFFDYKYDYREEWLRFMRSLFAGQPDSQLRERAIQAIAQIVQSPGGILWWRQDNGQFEPVARWNMLDPAPNVGPSDGALLRILEQHEWVINLDEQEINPKLRSSLKGLKLPEWLHNMTNAWLVVPLILHEQLFGFVVLAHSDFAPVKRHFNWEDCDLLKTAGRQAASHLAQLEAAQALSEARQFETFNRLSAYVVHDLKNLVAQLSLVVSNSAKHKHNPLFMDDVIRTVDNSVARMNRLLAQLRRDVAISTQTSCVDLAQLLNEIVQGDHSGQPPPAIEIQKNSIFVNANRDRLTAVIGHVIQNARDATPPNGHITVRMRAEEKFALVEVEDTGCGMDETFIRESLFRPFKTTKGSSGMGIGAYETREFVRSLGGDVDVVSRPGHGSIFRLRLPSSDPRTQVITNKTGNG
jgi:putative PEP-CTERM system histidine kinase